MSKKSKSTTPTKDKFYFPKEGVQVEADSITEATEKVGDLNKEEQETQLND